MEKVTVPDQVVDLVNQFKARGVVPDKVYLNKKDLNKKLPLDKVQKLLPKGIKDDEVKSEDLPNRVDNLSNRFKTYGDALDYVYRDTLKKKDEMSDSEDGNVENKKKKLARLSTVLKNHKGNLNKEPATVKGSAVSIP